MKQRLSADRFIRSSFTRAAIKIADRVRSAGKVGVLSLIMLVFGGVWLTSAASASGWVWKGWMQLFGSPTRVQQNTDAALSSPVESHGTVAGGAYKVTTFDVPGAGSGALEGTAAIGIDAAGDSVGVFSSQASVFRGFVRSSDGSVTTFDSPSAGERPAQGTIPISINSIGEVAGTSIDANNTYHGFLRSADGAITEFDTPGAGAGPSRGTAALSINDSGEIVGFYSTGSSSTTSTYHGFLRATDGTITSIDDPKADSNEGANKGKRGTQALSINARGDITGTYVDANDLRHGFVRTVNGKFNELDPQVAAAATLGKGVGMKGTFLIGVSSSGDIAGTFMDANNVRHGFLRSVDGKITTFDSPNAAASAGSFEGGTFPVGMDPDGRYLVGSYSDAAGMGHGFVRTSDGKITTFDMPGAAAAMPFFPGTHAFGVNASGNIVGAYSDANEVMHGYVLTPTVTSTPTVTLTSSLNPSIYGSSITLTATVAVTGASPVAEVRFLDGTTFLGTGLPVNGVATLTTNNTMLNSGTHSITANFEGGSTYGPATSNVVTQVVNKETPTVTLSSNLNPSTYGTPVTFSAAIVGSGGTAIAPVAFMDGATTLGTVGPRSGTATFTTSALSAGPHTIMASFLGGTNYNAAVSGTITETVDKGTPTVTVISSLNPSGYGTPVMFTATVAGGGALPTGTATFTTGGVKMGTVKLSGGVAKFTTSNVALNAGNDLIEAIYGGNSNYAAATSSTLTQTVNKSTPTVALTSSLNPSTAGTSVTFTAVVTGLGSTPLHHVTFMDGSATLGTVAPTDGIATFSTTALTAGTHSITAVFVGGSNYTAATSNVVSQTVN